MLDGVSLDQLRIFIAAADHGSFSAAARKLTRAQSAISESLGNLEAQMGVELFDRSGRYPKLTRAGAVLLTDARSVMAGVDTMKARAKGMSSGVEPELSAVVDVFFPIQVIASAAKQFRERFPGTPLRLYGEALGGVPAALLGGRGSLGIMGPLPSTPPSMSKEPLAEVRFVMVAAHDHPLAKFTGPIPRAELAKHVQLVLTDRSEFSEGWEIGVMSPFTWKLTDLFAKHAFLLNGLGWGGMPRHSVQNDIESGKLVPLEIDDVRPGGTLLTMFAVYLTASPPGPAGRWLIERLKLCPSQVLSEIGHAAE